MSHKTPTKNQRGNTRWRIVVLVALSGMVTGAGVGQAVASELNATSTAQTGQATVSARCTTQTPNYFETFYVASDQSYRLQMNVTLGSGGAGCVSKDYKLALLSTTTLSVLDQWSGAMPATTTSNLPNVANTSMLPVDDVPANKALTAVWLSESP